MLLAPPKEGEYTPALYESRRGIEPALVKQLEEGEVMTEGRRVRLSPHAGSPGVYDAETEMVCSTTAPRGGPPRVASKAYRANYDYIFQKPNKGPPN